MHDRQVPIGLLGIALRKVIERTLGILQDQPTQLWCTIPLDAGTGVQDVIVRGLPLPLNKFMVFFENQSGVTLAATLNTLKIATANYNLNA